MTWHLTAAQRVANARKARMTMRSRGEVPFGGKQGGGWGQLTPEQRHERALKSAETRRARGEKPFGGKYGQHSSTRHVKQTKSASNAITVRRHGSSDWNLAAAERVVEAKQQAAARRSKMGQ